MNKPIVFLDLETTGPDIVQDRAVQFAGSKTEGLSFLPSQEINILLNPGIKISPSAMAIHGITDEMVADKPSFCDQAEMLFQFLGNCDYAGFNIVQFDVPMLSEEFARCGYLWPSPGTKFYDAYVVFREKEKRDLSGAMKFYCGYEHNNAHDALADVHATHLVMIKQMKQYDDLKSLEEYADFSTNANALDLAGKIILNEDGVAVYSFGKDKGKSVKHYPSFGNWMLGQSFPANTKNIVRLLISNPS